MPSRVIRESLLDSDRWLGLAHPSERLAFIVLMLHVDDLGTCDASDGQLVRMWREPCNVKGRDDALHILEALVDADLTRTYEVDHKRYLFLPRFRQRFRAHYFKRPPPPQEILTDEVEITENIREIIEHSAKMTDRSPTYVWHLPVSCRTYANVGVVKDVVEGVVEGGGVVEPTGVGIGQWPTETGKITPTAPRSASPPRGTRLPKDWKLPQAWGQWALAQRPAWSMQRLQEVEATFRDYWIAQAGQRAMKLDWEATWRNWVRKEGAGNGPRTVLSDRNKEAFGKAKTMLFGPEKDIDNG